ncbi:hypothetical protein ACMA1I_02960 [Pontibacter sp. 13R65]|uniref:hypothetical protein n=1 Tax=Pontibacter sp. 13R65 TaxID=3127458 RepID=UPI00301C5567
MNHIFKNVFFNIDANHLGSCLSLELSDINFAVNVNNNKAIQDVYRIVSSGNTYKSKFIFNLQNCTLDNFETAESIGRTFFLNNYYYNKSTVPLLLTQEEESKSSLSLFKWCENQGLVSPQLLSSSNNKEVLEIPFEKDEESFYNILFDLNSVTNLFYKVIIIEVKEPQVIGVILNRLKLAEELLITRNPELYNLISYCSRIELENDYNIFLHKYYLNEHANSKAFLRMLHSSSETKIILDFYQEQYEVLPLWYKRVGHIIKILMGKRNIQSYLKK